MNCPRCGKALPVGAGFCMYCGQHLTAPAPVHPTGSYMAPAGATVGAFDAQRKKARTAAIASSLFAVAAFLVLGLRALGFLHLFASNGTTDALQKTAHLPPPALEKIASTGPPVMEKTETRIVMPDNIRDWLEHLHQTELARVAMTNGQIAQGMVEKEGLSVAGGIDGVKSALNGIDDPNSELKSPVDGLAAMLKNMHDQSADIQRKFDTYPAPDECVPIQAAYDAALSETTSEIGDIADHLAAGDIGKLQGMKGVSVEGIDSNTVKTDRLVGEICDKYNTKKWFSINKDIAPGGVFSMPGF